MKKRIAVAAVLLIALVAVAGPIKTWSAGEVIVASDLNANFQHIHNLMVGGHGARLVNSDVSASAGISHSKLATPALIPKAMGGVYVGCDGGTCGWNVNSGFASTFSRAAAGQYTLTFSAARSNANYVPLVSSIGNGVTSPVTYKCSATPTFSTTAFGVRCGIPGGADQDVPFSVVVFDDNN